MAFYTKGDLDKFIKEHPDTVALRISDGAYSKIENFAKEIVKYKKKNEMIHKVDGDKETRRQVVGLMGEYALEKILGINIIEQTVGDSCDYNHPDIPGYAVGIKSAHIGYFPLVPKKNNYAQIITIVDLWYRCVYVLGLATPGTLNVYQTDKYVTESVKKFGQKKAFVGFEHLLPVHSLEDLKDWKV